MRLSQEQTRRTNTFSSNKKTPINGSVILSSTTSSHRKKHEHTLKSNGSKNEIRSQNHMPSNYDKNQFQQNNIVGSPMLMSIQLNGVKDTFRPIKIAGDERRDAGPSEHYQQQVNHHYDNPVKSRPVFHSHDVKPQRSVGSSSNCKKQSSTKTYRHGLTVQELKEMTRSRLAAEASCDQVTDEVSCMQRKPLSEEPVRKVSLLQNIRERLNLDASSRQKSRSSEPMLTVPSLGTYPSNSFSSCNKNNSREESYERIRNVHPNQNAQRRGFLHDPTELRLKDSTSPGQMYQDSLLSLHSSYSHDSVDAFDNSSVNSFNSGRGSQYLGSESPFYHSSGRVSQPNNSHHHSASFREVGRASETRDLMPNSNTIGGSLLSSNSTSSSLAPSDFLNYNYENQHGSQQRRSSHKHEACNRIHGKGSSDTLPTTNLSSDSYSETDVPLSFSSPMTNLSLDSFCDSEETDFVPINFCTYNRSASDGSFSRNGDVPNSVAESVLTPHGNALSGGLRDQQMQYHRARIDRYDGASARHSSVEPTYLSQDRYNGKSWDDPDEVSIAQFLDDFQTRFKVDSSGQASSSSFFVSKIDPEII